MARQLLFNPKLLSETNNHINSLDTFLTRNTCCEYVVISKLQVVLKPDGVFCCSTITCLLCRSCQLVQGRRQGNTSQLVGRVIIVSIASYQTTESSLCCYQRIFHQMFPMWSWCCYFPSAECLVIGNEDLLNQHWNLLWNVNREGSELSIIICLSEMSVLCCNQMMVPTVPNVLTGAPSRCCQLAQGVQQGNNAIFSLCFSWVRHGHGIVM